MIFILKKLKIIYFIKKFNKYILVYIINNKFIIISIIILLKKTSLYFAN